MPGETGHPRIPDPVPPFPLPELEYDTLEKGERIGTGGDADVYRATVEHDGYTYTVAVKEPRFEGTIQKRVVERFQEEAETWSQLDDHDNIVSVYARGIEPFPWLALEYMDGGTLNERLGDLAVDQALWLAGRVAEGIRHGHRHGIAHLDIKPTNILLRQTPVGKWDYPKVSDWGLAKLLLEHSNSVEGISPTYAAPEQFDPDEYGRPDDITDIYQLGTIIYELLVGEPPFTGSSTSVMQSVLKKKPDPPSEHNPSLPSEVDTIVLKALAKDKYDRYETVVTLRQEIDQLFETYASTDIGSEDMSTGASAGESRSPTQRTPTETATEQGTPTPDIDQSEETTATESDTISDTISAESDTTVSKTDTSQSDGPTFLTRRRALLVIGTGIIGTGGLFISSQGNGENARQGGAAPVGNTPTRITDPAQTPKNQNTDTTSEIDQPEGSGTTGSLVVDGFENESFRDVWNVERMAGDGSATITDNRAYKGDQSLRVNVGGDVDLSTGLQTDDLADDQTYFAWIYPVDSWGKIIYRLNSTSAGKRADIRFSAFGNIEYSTNKQRDKTVLISNPETGQWYRLAMTIHPSENDVDFTVETESGNSWQAKGIPATFDINQIYLRGGDYTPNFTFYVDQVVVGVS